MAVLKVQVDGKDVEANDIELKVYLATDKNRQSCILATRIQGGQVDLGGLNNNELYLFVADRPISTEATVMGKISEMKTLKFGPLWVGDYNDDNNVDDFDFITFKTHYQNNNLQSDFNGDNKTDDFDFIIFKTSYGAKQHIRPIENDENNYNRIESGDQWYKISFNQPGVANFYVESEDSNLDVDLYVYDSNKTTLLEKSIKRGAQYDLVSEMQVINNKTYYIRIKHASGSGIYQLRTKCYMQLNNDQNVTNAIETGEHWYTTIFYESGKANFFVDPSDNLDVDLYVYDSEQTELGSSRKGAGIDDLVKGVSIQSGKKYYVKVKHYGGKGSYNLRCKNYSNSNVSIEEMVRKFPNSYRAKLRIILEKYPTWIVEPMNINVDWNTFIREESKGGLSLVNYPYKPNSWVDSSDPTEYYDGWKAASTDVIKYFADPRNYFNERYLFCFEKLSYDPKKHDKNGIKAILTGTFMNTDQYIEYFMEAAIENNISPYFLVSMARLEMGINGCTLAFGRVPGCEGYYNYYNIGANGSNPALNGALYAKRQGWNTIEKAIKGGAKFSAEKYISIGQDTKYLFKFDLVGAMYSNQYVQNIEAAYEECSKFYDGYKASDSLNNSFVFKIPVFNNMPVQPCPKPL